MRPEMMAEFFRWAEAEARKQGNTIDVAGFGLLAANEEKALRRRRLTATADSEPFRGMPPEMMAMFYRWAEAEARKQGNMLDAAEWACKADGEEKTVLRRREDGKAARGGATLRAVGRGAFQAALSGALGAMVMRSMEPVPADPLFSNLPAVFAVIGFISGILGIPRLKDDQ